nr:immunoglobulin heavy chain junction region [Macaca mulatta]MOX00684.1 immunoglobulin heavy chain junction region [Macaca mulatta]MOX04080.1 immunoglobulin heavy chain junction region [Macaca mulatta]
CVRYSGTSAYWFDYW